MSPVADKLAFFTAAYFKVNVDDLLLNDTENIINIIEKCISKAYQDVKRNIHYKYSLRKIEELGINEKKEFEKLKLAFYNDVSKIIVNQIVKDGRISIDKSDPITMIEKICKICADEMLFDSSEHITVGIAQKWVNMT